MVRCNRMKIVFMLVLFLGVITYSQDKQANEDKDKKLREEILMVYQAKGEPGLRDFFKKSKNRITDKFIVNFAEAGVSERKEDWLKTCEIMAEEKKDEKTLADVLYNKVEYLELISKNKEAKEYSNKALTIYQKLNDLVGQGNIYLIKGIIYTFDGDMTKASEMLDRSLSFFKKAGNFVGQANVFERKGKIFFYRGEYDNAEKMYDNAILFNKKAGDKLIGLSNNFLNKGMIYVARGDYENAEKMLNKALVLSKKANDTLAQGNIFWQKGDIFFCTGKSIKAKNMYEKALVFYEKLEELIGQGNVYIRMGGIYLQSGENFKAFNMFNKALACYEKAQVPWGQGYAYLGKGDVYMRANDNSNALKMYNKALPFFEKSESFAGLGDLYLSIGVIYSITGKKSKDLLMYEKALSYYEKVEQSLGQANVYHGIGDIYSQMEDSTKAEKMYNQALSFYEKIGNHLGIGNVCLSKGKLHLKEGNYSYALEMFNKAISLFEKIGELESISYSLYVKAKTLIKKEKKDESLALFEKGMIKLEKVRTKTSFSEMKRTFWEKVSDQYKDTVLFMLENKYDEKGFKYAESMKARVFLDQMAEGLVPLEKGLKPELKAERDNLLGKLSALTRQMQETPGKEEKKLQELKEEYHRIDTQFEDLLIKIRLENPIYASVNYPQPVSVQDLQTDVLKKGETLLSYFISPYKTYAFIVSPKKFKVKPLPVNETEINQYVKLHLRALKENNPFHLKRYGSLLYKKLFKPLEKYLKKSSDIIIVPNGPLETIPFESLIVTRKNPERPIYLLEKYRLKYIQGASLLSILRKHYTGTGTSTAKSFIGFGDPVYDYENFKQGQPEHDSMKILATESTEGTEDEIKEIHRDRYARAGGIMDRLPNSGEEIKSIAHLFEKKSLKTQVLLREQATEDNAKAANMKDFAYIHLSCHGLLNDVCQGLVLSQLPAEKSKEDGYFTLNEIMNCDYNAQLVVLSACETGSGKMFKGEGVTGLTRAVMYAGSPAVVASLWKVDDEASEELMVYFYRNLLEKNLEKAEALRQAKLEMLKNKNYSNPLYWSAFVMYGE